MDEDREVGRLGTIVACVAARASVASAFSPSEGDSAVWRSSSTSRLGLLSFSLIARISSRLCLVGRSAVVRFLNNARVTRGGR